MAQVDITTRVEIQDWLDPGKCIREKRRYGEAGHCQFLDFFCNETLCLLFDKEINKFNRCPECLAACESANQKAQVEEKEQPAEKEGLTTSIEVKSWFRQLFCKHEYHEGILRGFDNIKVINDNSGDRMVVICVKCGELHSSYFRPKRRKADESN